MEKANAAWTAYWRAGHQDSCLMSGQRVDTSALWTSFFGQCHDNDRILDAGCGAGRAARIALEHNPSYRLTGVDIADIPAGDFPGTLLTRTPLERLPFDNDTFDVAVSQFGIEYSDLAQTIPELARVLVPGGKVGLLLHHESVAEAANRELESIADLLAEDGLALQAVTIGRARAAGKNTASAESELAQRFQAMTQMPLTPTREWAFDYFAELMQAQAKQPPNYLIENGLRLFYELQRFQQRMEMVRDAGLSPAAVSALAEQLTTLGVAAPQVEAVLDDNRRPFAWAVFSRLESEGS